MTSLYSVPQPTLAEISRGGLGATKTFNVVGADQKKHPSDITSHDSRGSVFRLGAGAFGTALDRILTAPGTSQVSYRTVQ